MAGLRDAYRYCGNTAALDVEKSFADWLDGIVTPLNDEQVQTMLRCEHGGISETLADLFADTKDEKYLGFSKIFYHKAILDSLKAKKRHTSGKTLQYKHPQTDCFIEAL